MKKIYSLISILAISLFSANVLSAQTENQTVMPLLNVSPDAQAMSMAGAGVTMYSTAYSIWNNTAAAALSEERLNVGVSYGMWTPGSANTNMIAAAGYGRLSKMFTISAGIRTNVFASQPGYDINGNPTGDFSPYDLQATVGLGIRVLPILSLGVNVNYEMSSLGKDFTGNAFSADIAALLDLKFLRVGLTASNFGTKIQYAETASAYNLPANIKLGVGTTQRFGDEDKHAITASLQGGALIYTGDIFGEVGVEYMYNKLFRVAAGYHYGNNTSLYSVPSYASIGLGVNLWGVGINATYLIGTAAQSPITNSFNIGVSFAL